MLIFDEPKKCQQFRETKKWHFRKSQTLKLTPASQLKFVQVPLLGSIWTVRYINRDRIDGQSQGNITGARSLTVRKVKKKLRNSGKIQNIFEWNDMKMPFNSFMKLSILAVFELFFMHHLAYHKSSMKSLPSNKLLLKDILEG